jgi:tetratricopeptide (TPR) repeat protein
MSKPMPDLQQFDKDVSALQELARLGSDRLSAETGVFANAHRNLVVTQKEAVVARAIENFNRGNVYASEQICRLVLAATGRDVKTLHLLATIATRLGHHEDAMQLLLDCLDLNPTLPFIRFDLANALFKSGRFSLALSQCDELLEQDPTNLDYAILKAAALVKLGQYENAIPVYQKLLSDNPEDAQILLRYGIALRIVGRTPEAIDAFRKAIWLDPNNGEACWNLANLKTFRFNSTDIDAMRSALNSDHVTAESRALFLFALGKALGDEKRFSEAFQYYAEANSISRNLARYEPRQTTELVERCMQVFSSDYFSARQKACDADDPIFIVGLPRSGSTLLEQILSNHSAIDATMELSEIASMVRSLTNPNRTGKSTQFPEVMLELESGELERLGHEYIKRTKPFRGTKRFFVDKAPHNFLFIGLIFSILPNARIVDARRNPFACGMSIFSQHFARGTGYAYDLEHIGLYYRDYLRLMNHWHDVLPGRILTVQYEDVVADMQREVRRMLDFCGLEFEPGCLEFYKSRRAVATVSSEQVRQPIYDSSLELWKNYEPYLAPLKKALESRPI